MAYTIQYWLWQYRVKANPEPVTGELCLPFQAKFINYWGSVKVPEIRDQRIGLNGTVKNESLPC